MDPRAIAHPLARRASDALDRLNARHPWSHNDHFHPWILRNLPARRRLAIDVGCGRGLLLERLSPRFEQVLGTDTDAGMRDAAARRCAGLGNVTVVSTPLDALVGPADLVTMVAVLHHLDVGDALARVRALLAPGGGFLAVGLAPPVGVRDAAWDIASAVTNPLIGIVKHPRPRSGPRPPDPFPVADPSLSFDELAALVGRVMLGARLRHRLGFRHTIAWTKP